jgi:hypothetical protein
MRDKAIEGFLPRGTATVFAGCPGIQVGYLVQVGGMGHISHPITESFASLDTCSYVKHMPGDWFH